MGITFGDYLIDSGYYDPPEEETMPDENERLTMLDALPIAHGDGSEEQQPNARQYAFLKRHLKFTMEQRDGWEKRALEAEAKLAALSRS